ncbi:hypothetical protein TSAR_005483, partial [Trichomalopsis sarcophagae]
MRTSEKKSRSQLSINAGKYICLLMLTRSKFRFLRIQKYVCMSNLIDTDGVVPEILRSYDKTQNFTITKLPLGGSKTWS